MRRLYLAMFLLVLAACNVLVSNPVSPDTQAPSQPTLVEALPTQEVASPTEVIPIDDAPIIAGPTSVFPDSLPELDLSVELIYDQRWMRVEQQMTWPNTSSDTWTEMVFNTPINVEEGAFFLDFAHQGEQSIEVAGLAPQGQSMIVVPLVDPVAPGDTLQLELRYRVVFPPVDATSWPPVGNTGWTPELIQAGEWYPSPVPYIDGEGWQMWDYRPVGDPTVYPATDASLTIITDVWVRVASGGPVGVEEQDGKNVWRYEVYGARGIGFFASHRYEVLEAEADDILVYSYFLPEHADAGQAALDSAVQSIELFNDLYGPYPYTSLTVAENGFFGGMEYAAVISVTDFAYNTYQGQPNSLLFALVSHEAAHQWWYGAVGNDQANEPWLDESLAFYSELVFFENYYPDTVEWWWYTRVTRFETYGPVDASIYDYGESSDFIISVYGQAAYFIRDLRNTIGDEAFYAFLQAYYLEYAGEIVTAEDFFNTLRQHTDADLSPLIQVYFADNDL